jgi:hypothetical protein
MCIHVLDQTSVARGMITAHGVGLPYTILYSWHHLVHHAEIHGKIHQAVLMSADSTCHIKRPAPYYFNSVQSQALYRVTKSLALWTKSQTGYIVIVMSGNNISPTKPVAFVPGYSKKPHATMLRCMVSGCRSVTMTIYNLDHLHSLPNTSSKQFLWMG